MNEEYTPAEDKQMYRVLTDKTRSGRVTKDVARRIGRLLESRGEDVVIISPVRGRMP